MFRPWRERHHSLGNRHDRDWAHIAEIAKNREAGRVSMGLIRYVLVEGYVLAETGVDSVRPTRA
jgi:hypothetical protein